MSGWLGGGGKKVKPQYTGLQTQTSSSIMAIPVVWGACRVAPNIIWYGDFTAHKQKQKTGKGGGSVTTYTYSASLELALCRGQISGVGKMWKDQSNQTSYTAAGFTLFNGSSTQTPWPYLVTAHPTQALSYAGVAYLAVENYDLGQSNTLGQHSFEVYGRLYNTGVGSTVPDADPALLVQDFLTADDLGAIFPSSSIDLTTLLSSGSATTTGDSAYQTYCRAMSFALSPNLSSQETAANIIDRWTLLTNTAIVWTGYSLKFIPRGDQSVTANGVTYNPPTTVQYALTDKDYQRAGKGEDPILLTRADPADAYNSLKLTIKNRANDYNDAPPEWKDQTLIDQYGLRPASDQAGSEICTLAMGNTVVTILGQRGAYIRNTYKFKLSAKYCRLEPMDVVTCYDPRWGTLPVRIVDIEEDEDNRLLMTVEEFPAGVSLPATQGSQSSGSTPINTAVAPSSVSTPVIFEPRSDLTGGVAQVWAAVWGGADTAYDPNWGGCYVYVSSDNVTYQQIGQIDAPARGGKIVTATLPAFGGTNPDTVDTAHVDLTVSGGDLQSVTATDSADYVTLSYVGGELFSYEDATLVSANVYDLHTQLYRGLYGTTAGAHAVGAAYARLDENVFKWTLPQKYIGVTIYLKFQSYNIFGESAQDLSTCTAYTIVPAGTGFGSGTGGVPGQPTGVSATPGIQSAVVSWTSNPSTDNVTGYQVWRATGLSQPFSSAVLVTSVGTGATSYTSVNLLSNQAYTFFVVAVNAVGSSSASAGANVTTSGLISGGGASAVVTASEALTAGDFVNVYWTGTALAVRRAIASDPTKYANGFVLGASALGASATVYYTGMNTTAAPSQGGEVWLSDTTPGGYIYTPPTATGSLVQSIGTANPGVGVALQSSYRPEL